MRHKAGRFAADLKTMGLVNNLDGKTFVAKKKWTSLKENQHDLMQEMRSMRKDDYKKKKQKFDDQ